MYYCIIILKFNNYIQYWSILIITCIFTTTNSDLSGRLVQALCSNHVSLGFVQHGDCIPFHDSPPYCKGSLT